MMNRTMIPAGTLNDADLVAASISGNRDAFGQIVSRYQSLVCSLAYSATGSLSQSEDLAQDTFVTAWKQLRDLREPEKLRAWLCGIARNLINNFLRKEGREPSHRAEPLENISEGHSPEPLPVENTISKEEAAILWRSLEKIPALYREPLILFYREHQSVEAVATKLDLTEDTVKQRLSRGRKLLQEQFLNFIEGALAQTVPGPHFTLSVLSTLPALTLSAKAAALGGAAAKGTAAAKTAGALGIFGALLTPVAVIFGNYASYRASINEAQTGQERANIKKLFGASLLVALGFSAILSVPLFLAFYHKTDPTTFGSVLFSLILVVYFLTLAGFVLGTFRQRRRYLAKILVEQYGGDLPKPDFEYRSAATLFGLPLFHIRSGDRFDIMRPPVRGWIAVGSNHAVGVLFAWGGLAIAPISFGGVAIGLVSFGALGFGLFSLGAISFGVWAFGAMAVGWQICCGCGLAWNAAVGGIIAARDFAVGGLALASQVNNPLAQAFCSQHRFFQIGRFISNHNLWLTLAWIVPVTLHSQFAAHIRRRRQTIENPQPQA
jgi:RNA polymerase sigma factor (sigma-70 family)